MRAESTGLLGLGGSRSTWGRRLLEADVRSLRAELQAQSLGKAPDREGRAEPHGFAGGTSPIVAPGS